MIISSGQPSNSYNVKYAAVTDDVTAVTHMHLILCLKM